MVTTQASDLPGTAVRSPSGVRLVLNTASTFVGQAVVLIVTFLSIPYVTRELGSAQYGTLSLLIICVYSGSILNLGINISLVKYLAELMPKGEMENVQKYFGTALTALVGLGLLVGVAIFTAAEPIVRHFINDNGQFSAAAHLALRISSLAFVLQFLAQVLIAVLAGAQRLEIVSAVNSTAETLRLIGTVVIVCLGGKLVALMSLTVAVGVGTCLVYYVAAKRLEPRLRLRPSFSLPHFRSLINHSKFVLIGNTSRQLVGSADNLLIGYSLPVANLAYYGIAFSIAQRLWTLVGNVANVVFPAASAFSGSNQDSQVKELYLRSTKIAAAAGCFPALALAVFSREFMFYWLSSEFSTHGAIVLALLSIGVLVNSFSFVPYQTLQSTTHAAVTAKGSILYAAINIVMFILLIPHFGLTGAAVAFLISQFAFVPLFTFMADRLIGVPHSAVLAGYARVFTVALSACALIWLCRGVVHSLVSLGLLVGAGLALYTALTYRFVFDDRERGACRGVLAPVLQRLFPAAGRG